MATRKYKAHPLQRHTLTLPAPQMQDSLLNPHHRAFIVREVLPGEVDRLFAKYLGMLERWRVVDVHAVRSTFALLDSPRYYIFVLGLLAMQLGHPISAPHRRWMRENLHSCLLNRERVEQGEVALGFRNEKGEVLRLGSKTLNQTIVSLAQGRGRSWEGFEQGRGVRVGDPLMEVEMAARRMEVDNEVARLKGGSEGWSVDISAPVEGSLLVGVVEERSGGREGEVGCVDVAPERELGNWIAYREEKGLEGGDEVKKFGWTRNERRDREMRRVLRELLLSGVLLD